MGVARSAVQAVGSRPEREMEDYAKHEKGPRCIVDFEDVISVDTQGEDLLLEMVAEGAILFASRAYMKHILESCTYLRMRRGDARRQREPASSWPILALTRHHRRRSSGSGLYRARGR
jgi:hypothetical protein